MNTCVSVRFPIENGSTTVYCFPGSLAVDVGCMLGSGIVKTLSVEADTSQDLRVEIFDARLMVAPFTPFQSAGRRRFQIDVTDATPVYGSGAGGTHVYGTAITGGPAVGAALGSWLIPANSASETIDVSTTCSTGIVLRVTAIGGAAAADCALTVEFVPHALGGHRLRLAQNQSEHVRS